METTTTTLAQNIPAETMVANYNQAMEEIRQGYALLQQAEDRLRAAVTKYADVNPYHSSGADTRHIAKVLKNIRRQAWQAVAEKSEIKRLMSPRRAEEFDKQIEYDELPELTVKNLRDTLAGLAEKSGDFLREAVQEVFRILRPSARQCAFGTGKLKTNQRCKFQVKDKVILSGMVRPSCVRGLEPNYYCMQHYRALDNVFLALDGQGANKTHYGALYDAVREAGKNGCKGETPYFRFKLCKNGNLHLGFKRADLVEKLNAMAGEGDKLGDTSYTS